MILLVHPTAELYGSDRVFLASVSAMMQAGHTVFVSLAEAGPLEAELRSRGAEVLVCPSPILRKSIFTPRGFVHAVTESLRGITQGSRLIRQLQPELIYVNTITIPLWNMLAKMHRIPLLVHVHEGEASTGALMRKALALPLFAADAIVANSNFSAGVIKSSFKRLGARIQVLYNAVPGPSTPEPVRTELAGPLRLAYIGRLSPRKGVDVAIDALSILKQRGVDAELDLIGAVYSGYEWYQDQLHEQVRDYELETKVRFRGFKEEIWDLVAQSDIVVVPSRADEPFGNTAVEAILAGRPVIASETTGLIEAIAGYQAGTPVKANDPVALANAVQNMMATWADMQERLTRDLQTAKKRHSVDAYTDYLSEIVDQIISPREVRVFGASKG